jgi:chemotaxis protein MotB
MTRQGLLAVLLLLLCGCLVRASTYEAEVARAQRLSEKLELRELDIREFERRIQGLEKTEETLRLERGSLTEERLALHNELEDLREGNEALREEVARESKVRRSREAEIEELSGTYRSLVEQLEGELESGKLEIHRLRGRLQVRALDQILFDSGSVRIKRQGEEVLSKLTTQLKNLPGHQIRVEGHTDNVPIVTGRYPSNWELSVARAARVVRFMVEQGLDPGKLSAAGFGSHQPIAENGTPAGRSRNRRIEIVLVPDRAD